MARVRSAISCVGLLKNLLDTGGILVVNPTAKKILLSVLYLFAGPLVIILTIPIHDWSVVGGSTTALVISGSLILSVWKKK